MTGYPEPPLVGTETDTLVGSLERQRATFRYKCADLTTEQLRTTIGASAVTLGGLLKHLAYMEDANFTWDLAGHELPQPWAAVPEDGRGEEVWRSAVSDDAETLYRLWDDAVARSRGVLRELLAERGPDATYGTGDGQSRCAGCWSTSSRSTGGTPGTRTCSVRPSTGGSARTHPGHGTRSRSTDSGPWANGALALPSSPHHRADRPMYQACDPPLLDMHMITPGIAASLTPKSVERTPRPEPAPRVRRRLHLPAVLLHLPHPHLPHLPHRHA